MPFLYDESDDVVEITPPQPDMLLGDMLFQAMTQGVSLETTSIPSSYDEDDSTEVDILGNPRTSNFDVFEANFSEKATKAMSDRLAATKIVESPKNDVSSDSAS